MVDVLMLLSHIMMIFSFISYMKSKYFPLFYQHKISQNESGLLAYFTKDKQNKNWFP